MTDHTLDARCRFISIILADPDLMALLAAIRGLRLPQWRLGAGCLYQTVWNVLTGRARGAGIQDYDLIYFDEAAQGRNRRTRSIVRTILRATRPSQR